MWATDLMRQFLPTMLLCGIRTLSIKLALLSMLSLPPWPVADQITFITATSVLQLSKTPTDHLEEEDRTSLDFDQSFKIPNQRGQNLWSKWSELLEIIYVHKHQHIAKKPILMMLHEYYLLLYLMVNKCIIKVCVLDLVQLEDNLEVILYF